MFQTVGSHLGAGSNFPLRGAKGSLYEGGVRVPAFIYSPLLGHTLTSDGQQVEVLVIPLTSSTDCTA
jgi:arylsulfatase A-like enzyme